jgi:hypothetical protein
MTLVDDRELAVAILKYLTGNPEGMDTLQGIARFWILRQEIETRVEEVESVVSKLLQQGYLTEREIRTASGDLVERYFQLNRSRLAEITKLLEGS